MQLADSFMVEEKRQIEEAKGGLNFHDSTLPGKKCKLPCPEAQWGSHLTISCVGWLEREEG